MRGSWNCLNSVRMRQPLSYASVMRSFLLFGLDWGETLPSVFIALPHTNLYTYTKTTLPYLQTHT